MKLMKFTWKELSFTRLLQIGFSATLVMILVLFSVTYYAYTSSLLTENIRTSLRDFAISAQYIINGDKHQSIVDADQKTFKEMCEQLAQYKEAVGVYDVYTLVKGDDAKHTKFLLAAYDAEETFMKSYIYTKEMKEAFSGKIAITDKPYKDDFGTFYSGYAPLYNSHKEIIGIVAVDINIEKINALKTDIIEKALILFAFCFIVGNLLVYLVARSLGKNFNSIIRELKKIGDGDLYVGSTSMGRMPIIAEMKDLEITIKDMAKRISSLIQIITINAQELKTKASHISELLVTTDTSSQIMSTAIEQMSKVHQDASISFDQSLEELLMYKEDSTASIDEYRAILGSVQTTKENLESILQYLHQSNEVGMNEDSVGKFEMLCQQVYIQYDLFAESMNAQIHILNKISDKRDRLVALNQEISTDFKSISKGNLLVMEAMEKQVAAIQGAVKDVETLEEMANDLNEKLALLNTRPVEDRA